MNPSVVCHPSYQTCRLETETYWPLQRLALASAANRHCGHIQTTTCPCPSMERIPCWIRSCKCVQHQLHRAGKCTYHVIHQHSIGLQRSQHPPSSIFCQLNSIKHLDSRKLNTFKTSLVRRGAHLQHHVCSSKVHFKASLMPIAHSVRWEWHTLQQTCPVASLGCYTLS